MFVAVCDQDLGTSTFFCSKITSPLSEVIPAVRSSHSIASNGGTVASEYRRVNVRPRNPRAGRSEPVPCPAAASRPIPIDLSPPAVPVSRSVALIPPPFFALPIPIRPTRESSRQRLENPSSVPGLCLFSDVSRTIRELDIRVKPARRAVKGKTQHVVEAPQNGPWNGGMPIAVCTVVNKRFPDSGQIRVKEKS